MINRPKQIKNYRWALLCFSLMFTLCATSCKDDPVVIPDARNSFTGQISGTDFNATVIAAQENNGFYAISGNINTDANFQLYINGGDLTEYQIATDGPFVQTIEILNEIADSIVAAAIDPNFDTDSALVELTNFFEDKIDSVFADTTAAILQNNEAFLFYTIEDIIYYSISGVVNLTAFDEELLRLDGDFNMVLSNSADGIKSFEGIFEDVQLTIQ